MRKNPAILSLSCLTAVLLLNIQLQAGDVLRPGLITDQIVCLDDPEQSYALYLPSNYHDSASWPLVLIFDPAARGRMAVEVFREAGEALGMVIMCSNNSSNSSHEGSEKAASAMFQDAFKRFHPDTARIFVSGFSGGGRFSSRLALSDQRVKGVISCGSGLYHLYTRDVDLPEHFRFYGIMGWRDMNLMEMPTSEDYLRKQRCTYHVQYVDMAHVWPDSMEVLTALSWMMGREDLFLEMQEASLASFQQEERILDAAGSLSSLHRQFPDHGYGVQQASLESLKAYRKQVKQRDRAFSQEKKLRKMYLDALSAYVYATPLRPDTVHTGKWWEAEITRLNSWEEARNLEQSRMASRLKYLLEAHFSEDMEKYEQKGLWDKALFIADLWMETRPEKLWALWNIALCYASGGRDEDAIPLVVRMLESGLADPEWFMNSDAFGPLMGKVNEQISLQ